MSDTLKSILLAFVVIVGFALFFAVLMPAQTGAWDSFAYFGGVLGVWAFVAIAIVVGNTIADSRARKRDLLPAVLIGLLTASSLLSCQRTPAPAAIELRTAQEGDTVRWATQSYEDARGYTHTIPAGRAW